MIFNGLVRSEEEKFFAHVFIALIYVGQTGYIETDYNNPNYPRRNPVKQLILLAEKIAIDNNFSENIVKDIENIKEDILTACIKEEDALKARNVIEEGNLESLRQKIFLNLYGLVDLLKEKHEKIHSFILNTKGVIQEFLDTNLNSK